VYSDLPKSIRTNNSDVEVGAIEDTRETINAELVFLLDKKMDLTNDSEDSDIEGGVRLTVRHTQ
jgi:hypothetical protein